jgi:hypothetical protein
MGDNSRTPISDLERIAKIAQQVRAGVLPENDAIFAVAQIIDSSATARKMSSDNIEALSKLISGYFLWCRHVGTEKPAVKPAWMFEDGSGWIGRAR